MGYWKWWFNRNSLYIWLLLGTGIIPFSTGAIISYIFYGNDLTTVALGGIFAIILLAIGILIGLGLMFFIVWPIKKSYQLYKKETGK